MTEAAQGLVDPETVTRLRAWVVDRHLIQRSGEAADLAGTIDPVAIVTDNGRHSIVTGPVVCTAGETAYLRVTVTQRPTGAVAQGLTRLTGTGASQQWEIHAVTDGKETFQEGPATAVALGRTTLRGKTTDAHQWLVEITLEEE